MLKQFCSIQLLSKVDTIFACGKTESQRGYVTNTVANLSGIVGIQIQISFRIQAVHWD